jgi:type II secretory pathway pseudopilin PulG
MANLQSASRRGITLMEVLISIGILAIGFSSVLSLIPAGKAKVTQAIIYDRATNLAANALADAATFGLLKPECLQLSGSSTRLAVFDPAWNGPTLWGVVTSNTAAVNGTSACVKPQGIFSMTSSATFSGTTAACIVLRQLAQGRDDVTYNAAATDDALPTNQFASVGPRAFQGRMSCIIAVTSTAMLSPGNLATLSAIVFHNRDLSAGGTLTASASWDGSSAITSITPPSDRTLREVVRPGTVVTTGTSFHELAMAAIDSSTNSAYVTFSGAQPPAGPIQILLDSVGLSQQTVVLEGPGPWTQ